MVGEMSNFQNLSTSQIAEIVREHKLGTVVFAAGGTKRWFILNHLDHWPSDRSFWQGYLERGGERFLEISKLFFDHGVTTLLTHAVIPSQLKGEGKNYLPMALTSGMDRIAATPQFLDFYDRYGVRVRFFGNYRQVLTDLAYPDVLAMFDHVQERTRSNDRHLLLWGFNSDQDQLTPIMKLAVEHYQKYGVIPDKNRLIELYYGELVPPVDIYITFNRLRTSIFPPLLEGQAELYFTVGLSFDFAEEQLRSILYDYLVARKGQHREYSSLSPDAFAEMKAFYQMNRGGVIGVGRHYEPGNIWYPLPQVRLPRGWGD